MLNLASARRRKRITERLNLVPILDAVFIFIFFLLASSQFVKMYEVSSDIPVVSDEPPTQQKNNQEPLNLTIRIRPDSAQILTGDPLKVQKSFKISRERPDFSSLHTYLVELKKNNISEDLAILEPYREMKYQTVVALMDAVRAFWYSDPPVFAGQRPDKDQGAGAVEDHEEAGGTQALSGLFPEIIFGNLES